MCTDPGGFISHSKEEMRRRKFKPGNGKCIRKKSHLERHLEVQSNPWEKFPLKEGGGDDPSVYPLTCSCSSRHQSTTSRLRTDEQCAGERQCFRPRASVGFLVILKIEQYKQNNSSPAQLAVTYSFFPLFVSFGCFQHHQSLSP